MLSSFLVIILNTGRVYPCDTQVQAEYIASEYDWNVTIIDTKNNKFAMPGSAYKYIK